MFASIYFRDFKDALKICGIFSNTYILHLLYLHFTKDHLLKSPLELIRNKFAMTY